MANINNLIDEMQTSVESMSRLLTNLKKAGRNNFTASILQGRHAVLNSIWADRKAVNAKIRAATSDETRKTLPYIKGKVFFAAEDLYNEVCDYIATALNVRDTPVNANSTANGNCTFSDGSRGTYTPLPRIDIPKFSGAYTDWVSFRDMFQSLVIANDSLPNVQKLHYLKMGVSGDASNLLKTISVTETNFQIAWDKLKDRYENSRHIIDSYLTKLVDVSAVNTENVKDLKRLRDHTYEATSSLKNLNRPVDQWDDIVTFQTVRKLDPISRREWEMRIGDKTTYPTYEEIHNFLDDRIRALESIAPPSTKKSIKPKGDGSFTKSHLSTASKLCECDETHPLHKCELFKNKSVEERQKFVKQHHLCTNCLSQGHKLSECLSKGTCYHCKQRHNTWLHSNSQKKGKGEKLAFAAGGGTSNKSTPAAASTPQPTTSADSKTTIASQHAAAIVENLHALESKIAPATVMLATAWVLVSSSNGRQMKVRALLDQGSQSSFVTESIAQTLRAPRTKVRAPISGIGGTDAGIGRAIVTLTLNSCIGTNDAIQCRAIVFQKLTSYVPQRSQLVSSWRHLEGLEMADPEPSSGAAIQLILGADVYANILREGLKRGPVGSPIAQKTTLGWILSGPTTSNIAGLVTTLTAHIGHETASLFNELRRFWELEEVPNCSPLSEEEIACEAHFAATHKRLPEGRYCVKLPFKGPKPIQIGSSKYIAENWLARLERKFTRNSNILEPYYDFMYEYLLLEHMAPTTFDAPKSVPAVYLPHHPVFKDSSTTQLRVVFNASSKTSNGTSLNDHLMVGPKLQSDLPSTILRWRQYQFALTADISKMYRQIIVDPEDTRYQQILWRSTPESAVTPYKLLTVTYGTASAPYLAMRVLKQLADDEESQFPSAAAVVHNNFYIDDVLFGANEVATATTLRSDLMRLLDRGGFTLRKWMSSHASLLEGIPVSHQETTKIRTFDSTESIKILGIGWIPELDSFCFNASMPTRSTNTKRSVLSITAQLFDPLGWLSPVVITAKVLMQELWIAALEWDDTLPPELSEKWDDYCQRIPELQAISIPRWNNLASREEECEIHGFADASTRAYAAVVYLRTVSSTGAFKISLLTAKTKVAPIKTVRVPRLELCAAVLLAKLIEFVKTSMKMTTSTTYAWTDSNVVLAWLKRHPSVWPTFVANRVASIQHRLPYASWRHVPTAQNPADCASRGITATELCAHPLWWQGPPWLKSAQAKWPRTPETPTKEILTEASITKSHVAVGNLLQWELYTDISSWRKLIRVTAYCIRFIERCRRRSHATELKLLGDEICAAQTFWIKDIQREKFQSEIQAIQKGAMLPRNSPLRSLTPSLDEKGILRVGGRLERSNLSFEEKHPAILPKHRVSTLIVEDAHLRCLHGGPQLTISILRQNYWIIGHRPFVRNLIRKCVPCVRERAKVPTQIMGDLPAARVTQQRSFLHTGLDYAGPYLVRTNKGRGYKAHKAYLALFVCISTRAIHLELVSDYSSDAFLAAYRRFIARRGLPSDVYSDNGTTFQGAEKELQNAFKTAVTNTDLGNVIATDRTNWHFIPPGAPHFGGLWEAGVKCAKHHLKRVLGTHTLTYEEFNTLITQVEACLNSRPIGPLLTDPCEFAALTPGHFLIGAPLLSVPEPSLLKLKENRLSRWQLVQQMLENFWKRWSVEYFHSLQVRTKWTKAQDNIAVGNIVIIRNNSLPPAKWMLGKIIEIHPGSDSRVRVVTIRTAHTTLKRPITQICLLPVHAADPEPCPQTPSYSSDVPATLDTTDSFQDCDSGDMSSPAHSGD